MPKNAKAKTPKFGKVAMNQKVGCAMKKPKMKMRMSKASREYFS